MLVIFHPRMNMQKFKGQSYESGGKIRTLLNLSRITINFQHPMMYVCMTYKRTENLSTMLGYENNG